MNLNYNGWKEEKHRAIQYQLMFEAERDLLKREDGGKNTDFLRIGKETVGGVAKDCEANLRLHIDTSPSIMLTKNGSYLGMIYLKNIEKEEK